MLAYDAGLGRVCYVITGDRTAAEDATQTTWEIACSKLSQIRDPRRARQWLTAVAVREARRIVSRQPALRSAAEENEDPGRDLDLAAALGRLPAVDRQLLSLVFVAGMDTRATAKVLGLSPAGVRTRKARLLARLRRELEDG